MAANDDIVRLYANVQANEPILANVFNAEVQNIIDRHNVLLGFWNDDVTALQLWSQDVPVSSEAWLDIRGLKIGETEASILPDSTEAGWADDQTVTIGSTRFNLGGGMEGTYDYYEITVASPTEMFLGNQFSANPNVIHFWSDDSYTDTYYVVSNPITDPGTTDSGVKAGDVLTIVNDMQGTTSIRLREVTNQASGWEVKVGSSRRFMAMKDKFSLINYWYPLDQMLGGF
jgi:hypothetical protein